MILTAAKVKALMWITGVGALVAGGVIVWQMLTISGLRTDIAELHTEHSEMVAAAEGARARAERLARTLERERNEANTEVARLIAERNKAREEADAAARVAGDRLRLALDAVAELAGRAPTDPATAGRAHAACAATVDVLREADAEAGELAEEAGRLAGQVMGLQHYVRNVCLATPAEP